MLVEMKVSPVPTMLCSKGTGFHNCCSLAFCAIAGANCAAPPHHAVNTRLSSQAENCLLLLVQVLDELKASQLPTITVWNKVDACKDPDMVRAVATGRKDTLCISARTGEGVDGFVTRVEERLEKLMVPVQVLVPFAQFELCGQIHRTGAVDIEQYVESGVFIKGRVPAPLAQQLKPLTVSAVKQHTLV